MVEQKSHGRGAPATLPLAGRVAVVAGATRGAGRGIARALGETGATVYCTGRSVRGSPSPYGRPETIEETAELINRYYGSADGRYDGSAGGTAIALRVDHAIESEVAALFARIDREHGRLDVLVNSVAGEEPMMRHGGSFWKTELRDSEAIFRQAVLSHMIHGKARGRNYDPGAARTDRRSDRGRYSARGC